MGFSDWAKEQLHAALPKCYLVANSDSRRWLENSLFKQGFCFCTGHVVGLVLALSC